VVRNCLRDRWLKFDMNSPSAGNERPDE